MQIHEITQRRVDEGLWNKGMALANYYAGDYAKSAEYSQKELQSQGRDLNKETDPKNSWKQKYDNLAKTPGMTTYITGLAQEWLNSPDAKSTTPAPRAAPGQMPASVAASKTGQNMQQMLGQPKGGIQGMQSDLEESPEYTSPGGIVIPAGAKTVTAPTTSKPAPTAPTTALAPTDYAGKFQKWSDEKLATKVNGTFNQFATMDEVRQQIPGLAKKLDDALKQVVTTQGTAQQIKAIQEYLELASAGVQAIGQQKRYIEQQKRHKPGDESDATNDLGLTDRQLQSLKALAQTPAGKSKLVKDLGIV